MWIMGSFSILLNLIILFSALVKGKYLKKEAHQVMAAKVLPFMFWWLVGNTLANLFSESRWEALIFTPILLILTLSIYRIWHDKSETIC